jgi:hypothetical protein
MRWNTWMLGPVAAVLLAGCGGGGRNAPAGNPETGMQGTATDTGAAAATDTSKMAPGADTGMKADTGRAPTGATSDTAKHPSKKSGLKDTSATAPK